MVLCSDPNELDVSAVPAAIPAPHYVRVALDVPLPGLFDYCSAHPVAVGQRVIVPFGRRQLVGIVVAQPDTPGVAAEQIRPVTQVLDDLPPLPADWLDLMTFASRYYHRPLGEVMLPALPPPLRKASAYTGKRAAGGPVCRMQRRLQKQQKKRGEAVKAQVGAEVSPPVLNAEQEEAVARIAALEGHGVVLLRGVTGSGKTEVYLRAAERVLAAGRQVLFLVPEINLTPQLEQALRARFAAHHAAGDAGALAVMHSGLSDGERLEAWWRAFKGEARVLLGTRMAVTAPLPELGLIIVDEEHDGSYKQQDGLRYSARDLAVWRAHDRGVPVVLGSATPSLESWNHVQAGRYIGLSLTRRARDVALPDVKMVDTRRLRLENGFSPQLLDAMEERLQAREQVLVFINRRGYAPVLSCVSCGWVSQCPQCTAYTVLHRLRRGSRLQCHHCGGQAPVPRACPTCGDLDLKPMGRGTQRIEEFLGERFPDARIARIDADSTRLKGSAEALFSQVHRGEVDILVGTQMVAKGHDFANLGLVGVLNADSMLFAQDFRAPERLFAQLMQVAGRAGRHQEGGEVLLQTDYPDQPVYRALQRHDYEGFARYALEERQALGLPPFAYQALLMAESRELAQALQFLGDVARVPQDNPTAYPTFGQIMMYDPVPLRVVRVANIERAQLLVESRSRPALQHFLTRWNEDLFRIGRESRVRYSLEVDPFEI